MRVVAVFDVTVTNHAATTDRHVPHMIRNLAHANWSTTQLFVESTSVVADHPVAYQVDALLSALN